jgi:hypothetical protein
MPRRLRMDVDHVWCVTPQQAALPLLLIVDDEIDIIDTYAMLLELHGYR